MCSCLCVYVCACVVACVCVCIMCEPTYDLVVAVPYGHAENRADVEAGELVRLQDQETGNREDTACVRRDAC